MRPVIAVDLDDVLADHAEAFVEFSNSRYGTSLAPSDYDERWTRLWGTDTAEVERRAAEFQVAEVTGSYGVKRGAQEAIRQLAARHDLFVVTARRKPEVDTTLSWLDQHFPGVFQGVRFVPIWEPDNRLTKADICREIGADCLVDDLPRHCNLAAEGGLRAVLFGSYGWNRQADIAEGVTRCADWDQVLTYFLLS